MTLIPARAVLILCAIILGLGFLLGWLFWNKEPYKCYEGKHYYGDWVTVMAIGKFELRVKPYGCEEDDRYDPRVTKPLQQVAP